MKKKGFIHELKNTVTSKAKFLAKDFKKKHKLSGKTLNLARIFEGGVVHRAKLLAASSWVLLTLVIFFALMVALKEEPAKVQVVMSEVMVIGGVFTLLLMHFTAKLLVWAFFKSLMALFSPLLALVYPLNNLWATWDAVSGFLQPILEFLSNLFF